MSKRVYISADYSENDGDRDVINELHTWGKDNKHKVNYTINMFVSSQDKIVRKLTVCIRPKDYLDDRIDLKRVGKYIDYKCEFR